MWEFDVTPIKAQMVFHSTLETLWNINSSVRKQCGKCSMIVVLLPSLTDETVRQSKLVLGGDRTVACL